MLSFGTAPWCSNDKGNSSQPLPDYLPEDDDIQETSDKVHLQYYSNVRFVFLGTVVQSINKDICK